MAAPVQNASAFLALVSKSGLVDEAALAGQFDAEIPAQPSDAADFLVSKGILTGFQAKALLLGKHKGLILGPYKILDELGRGGMGIVYLAEHQKLQCRRAIKVLPKDSKADPLSQDRFYREARAVAALDHSNIIKAYDVSEADGVHYFVMEYVQGVNLQAHLQQKGALPWKAAVGFVAQACKGLQHAHERGLVHRDIKPGNLLVDRQGVLKILDLGLARCFSSDRDNLTGKYANASDEFMGSVDFMAPEVALGDQVVDIRTDIYSLGVTLFALVIGKPPFEGSPAQKLMQHQLKPVPPLHELRPEVPEMLSAVVARMTHKQVVQRYPTPAAVLDALAPWLGSTSAVRTVQPPAAPLPVTRPTQRIERQATRDTSPIRAEDTKANRPVMEEAEERDDRGHTSRRKRKRFKKKRSHGVNPAVWIVPPILLVVLGLGIWGGIELFRGEKSPTSTQVASANPPAQPGRQGGPPNRGGPGANSGSNPAMREGTPPPPADSNPATPPPSDIASPPENNPPPVPENNPPPRRPPPFRPPTPPPMPPASGEITGPEGPKNPVGPGPANPPAANPPAGAPPVGEGLKVGQLAPDIAGEDLDGVEFLLSDYRGKVVLLDFWAFW